MGKPVADFPLLAIKIGNTNISFGLFENGEITRSWRIETRLDATVDEYASVLMELLSGESVPKLGGIAFVSVVPSLTTVFQHLSRRYLLHEPFVATPEASSGISVHYDDARALGADRFVGAVAAKAMFGSPVLVIDFGTATTFNAVNREGEFVGGAIAPGLAMGAEALHRFTARLPLVDLSAPAHALASNTSDSLKSGLVFGYAGLVEGLITRLRLEMDATGAMVIATGGLAELIAPHCPSIDVVEPGLILYGLSILFEANSGSQAK